MQVGLQESNSRSPNFRTCDCKAGAFALLPHGNAGSSSQRVAGSCVAGKPWQVVLMQTGRRATFEFYISQHGS